MEVSMALSQDLLTGALSNLKAACVTECDADVLDERTVSLIYAAVHAVTGNVEACSTYLQACRETGLKEEQILHAMCLASCAGEQRFASVACDAFELACQDEDARPTQTGRPPQIKK
jgi:alkylhydroperoxidase/carboxymuconolactone decarboxylase family protein YurZ